MAAGTPGDTIHLTVNGFVERVPCGRTVAEVLVLLDEPTGHAIVELNGRYLHLRDYATTVLREGDVLEIILPASGG